VSREGAEKKPKQLAPAGTPVWVWIVYALGITAAAIFVVSVVFTLFVVYGTEGGSSFYGDVSVLGIVVWGVPMVAAALLWVWRRYRL
jgi:hypothetical protein